MATPTPNFGWQLPVPNSPIDANVWGTELNGNLSAQDTQLLSAFTNNIGNTAPVAPILTAGSTWINNTNPSSYIFNVYDGSQWVQMGTIDPITHTFIPVGSGGAPNVQIFTTSGTYTPTLGLVYAVIEGVGGGGAGGAVGPVSSIIGGNGGGGGGYFYAVATASTIGASQSITIGNGGIGGSGGTTSFGSLYVANGGTAGTSGSASVIGIGGGATGGLINVTGGYGEAQSVNYSGSGADSLFLGAGGGGVRISPASGYNGLNATGYGAGGGGAINSSVGGSQTGGNGSSGIIRIVEYL